MKAARTVLAIRPFRRLLLTYGVNWLGNWLGQIALTVILFRKTGSPLAVAALWGLWTCVPALVTPALVARLDTLRSDRFLSALFGAEALLFVALGFAANRVGIVSVLALAAIDGVFAVTARALAKATVVASMRPRGLLREGNQSVRVI